jgi:6-phosphogluconolactonase (cycloisomerase 2 family)
LETDGTITLLSKVPSGGAVPTSVTFFANTVYVLNSGATAVAVQPNIAGFTVDPAGLVPIAGSIQPLSSGLLNGPDAGAVTPVGASEILFMPGGSALVVVERTSSKLDTFPVSAAGVAGPAVQFYQDTQTPTVPTSNEVEPFGFSLTAQGDIVVSEAWAGATMDSSTTTFSVSPTSGLTQISHATSTQAGSCWTVVVGDNVYETNTASGTISQFGISSTGTLTYVAGKEVPSQAGAVGGPTDLAATADGAFVYAHTGKGSINIFAVSSVDGSLSAIAASPFVGIPTTGSGLVAR